MKLLLVVILLINICYSIPTEYLISGVPYQRQQTKYNCGDASLQMVFGYYNHSVNQKDIDDSARTSRGEGTLSYDIVRAAQFSILSPSMGTDKIKHENSNGYKKAPYGLNAVGYSQDSYWGDELKQLIANDIPVICLMAYALNDSGGHFRVIIGYNDTSEYFTTLDPWDRDGQPQVFNISYTDFQILWNYLEPNSPRGQPYFGTAIWDLRPTVTANNQGNLSYIYSELVYENFFPIQNNVNTTLPTALTYYTTIHLPQQVHLIEGSQESYMEFNVQQGDTLTSKWVVECTMDPCVGDFEIIYQLLITGSTPETYDTKNHNYPMYLYQDIIGKNYTVSF